MKSLTVMGMLIAGGVALWLLAERISSDALSMAMGIVLGIVAALPAALLVAAAGRGASARDEGRREEPRGAIAAQGATPQLPIIVLAGQAPQQWGAPAFAQMQDPSLLQAWPTGVASNGARQFRVVGEKDETLDEW